MVRKRKHIQTRWDVKAHRPTRAEFEQSNSRTNAFDRLDQRRKGRRGDREHAKAVAEHEDAMRKEMIEDPAEQNSTSSRSPENSDN